ncbi:MAG: Rdx family protein [Caldilineaceae bacterium]|nr:Rdx family protein [Caldilineaceae bacterium]
MAARAAEDLFTEFKSGIESMKLIAGGGGRFEVVVDGDLIYSKAETGRHAEEGELVRLVAEATGMVPKSMEAVA